MSKVIPQSTIDTFRTFNDISIETYGVDCTLYIPSNLTDVDALGPYKVDHHIKFVEHSTKVFMLFEPNIHRLRKLGIFTEDKIPILAFFDMKYDVSISSYFKLSMQFYQGEDSSLKTDEFSVVDVIIPHNMQDKMAVRAYKVVPRRAPIT